MEEVWKTIKESSVYQISNLGNIRSISIKLDKDRHITKEYKILKPCYNSRGYLDVTLKINKNKVHKVIHRLVAEAFIPNPNNYEYVNHKDENKSNNNVENLEWCNHKYNCNYGTTIERSANKRSSVIVRIVSNKLYIYRRAAIAAKLLQMNDISIRYRVNKGFLKDTKTKEVLEIWRKANQKEIDLLGNEDYIIINNLEVVN